MLTGASGAAALLAIGGAMAAAEPDAELIRLCADFDALQRQYIDCFPGGRTTIDDDDERLQALAVFEEPQKELLRRILHTKATTPAGFLARARTYYLYMDEEIFDPDDSPYWDKMMIGALIRDMVEARHEG